MKKAIGSACLAALLSMGMATAAGAQTNTAPQTTQANTDNEGDDSGKYGLAGLLGLLGLAGLLKRDRHDDHRSSGVGSSTR